MTFPKVSPIMEISMFNATVLMIKEKKTNKYHSTIGRPERSGFSPNIVVYIS